MFVRRKRTPSLMLTSPALTLAARRFHELFHSSLASFGVLALGHKESIRFTSFADRYEPLDADERIYRKVA